MNKKKGARNSNKLKAGEIKGDEQKKGQEKWPGNKDSAVETHTSKSKSASQSHMVYLLPRCSFCLFAPTVFFCGTSSLLLLVFVNNAGNRREHMRCNREIKNNGSKMKRRTCHGIESVKQRPKKVTKKRCWWTVNGMND